MDKGKGILIILGGIIVLFVLLMVIGRIMFSGSKEPVKKIEELEFDKPFNVYYSKRNSVFPLLVLMDFWLVFLGLVCVFSEYGKVLGIIILVITVPLLPYLILKVRNAKDDLSRPILRIDKMGLNIVGKEYILWEDLVSTEIYDSVRSVKTLYAIVRDNSKKNGTTRVIIPYLKSRFGPQYIQEVIDWYRARAILAAKEAESRSALTSGEK